MTLEEMESLFNKLREDETDVLCIGEFLGCGFALPGKVTKSEEGRVDITSDNGALVQLSLTEDGLVFGYEEPRDCPEFAATLPKSAETAMTLTIQFPAKGSPFHPERVIVVERFSEKK